MKSKTEKIFFCLFLFLFISGFVFAQEKALEVQYPDIPGEKPLTSQTSLADYVSYIYKVIITLSGALALGALIFGGLRYLSSMGKPEKLNEAKRQILSAFWGTVLLFASYLILYIINPQIVNLKILSPPPFPSLPSSSSPGPTPTFKIPDPLLRIKLLAEKIKQVLEATKQTSSQIKSLTDQCNCQNTQPVCACDAGGPGAACRPKICFAGAAYHPCEPNAEKIKQLQKDVTMERDRLLYYKNQSLAESDDFKLNKKNALEKEIAWYNKLISDNQLLLSQANEGEKKIIEDRIAFLTQEKSHIEQEVQIKDDLDQKLIALAQALSKIEKPTTELGRLPSSCFDDVKSKCQPSCKTGGYYGCHDAKDGCQPDKCSGGNPCPVSEIQTQVGAINQSYSEIIGFCNQIISMVENLNQ